MAEPIGFLIYTFLFAGLALARYFVVGDRGAQRALRRAAVVPIAEVKDGQLVKVIGYLRPLGPAAGPPLQAPLSGEPCAGYRVVVDRRERPDELAAFEEQRLADFLVVDASGKARVDVRAAQLVLPGRRGDGPGRAARELGFLRAHGLGDGSGASLRVLVLAEALLRADDRVAVLGVARWEPDPSPDWSQAGNPRQTPLRLVLSAPPGKQLLIGEAGDVPKKPSSAGSSCGDDPKKPSSGGGGPRKPG